ncbi:MAG: exodeoxyribonuclease V subunit alpha [Syntrophaceae bacterium]|nr:exodeoxyribonuclease V subunit alpha [Syntrophaceae bacterium]
MKVTYRDDVNRNFHNYFSSIDIHFGDFIADLTAENNDYLFLAAALASRAVRLGHVCLDLNAQAGSVIIPSTEGAGPISCPELKEWLNALQSSFCVGKPSEFKPLILDDKNRLYLQRYWQYEQDTARNILSRISSPRKGEVDKLELADKLQLFFPENQTEGKINWQKVAATAAVLKNFVVISGSPGTGKTTTITKIMALLLDVEKRNLRIALAAPTGKAAARLQESVRKTKVKLSCADAVKVLIPDDAQTIHRLLGSLANSPYFQFHEGNPLPYDLVVVDEASMADLPLLAKMFLALSAEGRVILLGDKDQLASVDAGVVLGDICAGNAADIYSREFADEIADLSGEKLISTDIPAGVQDGIIQLQTNFRFAEESGINILSNCVKRSDIAKFMELLQDYHYSDIGWTDLNSKSALNTKFARVVIDGYSEYLEAVKCTADREIIFDCLEKFRILCALRVGNWGTQRINAFVEKILSEAELINPHGLFYEGMPVMVTRNDYQLNLFNGDVGIILPDSTGNREMMAHFRNEQGKIKKIIPSRLPKVETVWAMTVHKSQGSEYDRVLLVLSDRDIPVATRELVYTGITRARRNVQIWAAQDVLTNAISRRIKRESGLTNALFPQDIS